MTPFGRVLRSAGLGGFLVCAGLLALDASGLTFLRPGALEYAAAFVCLISSVIWGASGRGAIEQGALRPLTLAPLILLGSSSMGLIGERLLHEAGIVKNLAPFQPASTILLTAAIALAVTTAVVDVAPRAPVPVDRRPQVSDLTLTVIDAVVVAATLALGAWFAQTGVIPMLMPGEADEARFAMARSAAFSIYSRFIYVGSAALALRLAIAVSRAHPRAGIREPRTILVVLPLLLELVLMGSKYLYVFPLGVAFLAYNRFRSRIRLWHPKAIAVGLGLLLVMVVVTNLRGLGRTISDNILLDVFIIVPEFRDMASSVAIADRIGLHVHTLGQLFWTAVPSELLTLFGMVRKTTGEQAFVYKDLLGYTFEGGSVRIGIFGELFMNARILGVIVGGAVIGGILAWLDRSISGVSLRGFGSLLAMGLAVQFLWMFQAEIVTMMGITYQFGLFFALVGFIEFTQQQHGSRLAESSE